MNVLPVDVLRLIADYAADDMRVRVDVEWDDNLLRNPAATVLIDEYIQQNGLTEQVLEKLARNPNPKVLQYITPLHLETFPSLVRILCSHPAREAIEMIRDLDHSLLDWYSLCSNPAAIDFVEENPDRWVIEDLLENPLAFYIVEKILLQSPNMRNWNNAINSRLYGYQLLSLYRDRRPPGVYEAPLGCGSCPGKVYRFSRLPMSSWHIAEMVINPNPEILPYIEQWFAVNTIPDNEYHYTMETMCMSPYKQVIDRVDLEYACSDSLSRNPLAIDILLEHPEHIRWQALAENPSDRVMEVVLTYEASFLASCYRGPMFRRPDMLEVDEEKKRDKVKFFISL